MNEPVGWGQRAWEGFLGFFIENKFVVWVIVAVLIGASLVVAPFDLPRGPLPSDPVPVDAIPDIGENQQIVFTRWAGRSPRDIEDQVSYPLTTALLGIPGVKTVRSFSMLGFSSIYVIFEDGVEFYWSRSRVLEKLSSLPAGTLPNGVAPQLGPDATALGQVFWYTLEGRDPDGKTVGGWELHELRSVQDWQVRYALQAVPGVSEVASVGGYVQEYQIDVDPEAMVAHGIKLGQVADAVRRSNMDVGARTLEINQVEYVLRGLGFVEDIEDLESTVVAVRDNIPIRVRDVAKVGIGPANRRGGLDDAGAEAVGGVVVARFGENPMAVIDGVKEKIKEIQPGLPRRTLEDGSVSQITIVPFYDRSTLIGETLGTLSTALWQQILITVIVVLVMLRNLRSSILISSMLPLAVLATFLLMKFTGVDANIMSLAGIAIAIGTMVDMGIVFTENITGWLERLEPGQSRLVAVRSAAAEVAPAVLTSVATTVVSFLPVFALTASEGKLFTPLAFTKTFALGTSLLFALIVLPPLAHLIIDPKVRRLRPADTFAKTVWRSVFRAAHIRDFVWIALGVSVAVRFNLWLGLFIVFVGCMRLMRPLLPMALDKLPDWLENGIAIIAMALLLTWDWLPLGPEVGEWVNLVFVAGIIGIVLAVFAAFLRAYPRMLRFALDHKILAMALPTLIVLVGFTAWRGFDKTFDWIPDKVRKTGVVTDIAHALPGFGREFMPPFDEGSYLYMPTTMPHASYGEAKRLLSELDASIKMIPEVDRVVGKIGRVESPLDPAPVSMIETVVTYIPEYRTEPDGTRVRQWRDHIRTPGDIWTEIVAAGKQPGLTSAPELMPIATRIVMLQSGMRAPMGIKVYGPDLETIEKVGLELEVLLKNVPSIRKETVFAERIVGKPYLEIDIDREAIGRHGLRIHDVQMVITTALGGQMLTSTVEGRERYPVRVRYMREDRDSVEAIQRVLVPTMSGEQIPLGQLAEIRYVRGPQVIKAEDTFLTGYVIFDRQPDVAEIDTVEQAQTYLNEKIAAGEFVLPDGVSYRFTGTYENQVRSEARLAVLIPLALVVVFLLLYLQFRRAVTSVIIYTGVIVAVSGGFLLLWLYGQPWFMDFEVAGADMRGLFQIGPTNMSVAVWVGVIALVGIATDNGVVVATYIKQRLEAAPPSNIGDIRERVLEASNRRVLPCLMTTATTILALLPVITSQGRGADVMVPMAIPSLGGMSIQLVTLFVVPVLYAAAEEIRWHWIKWRASVVEHEYLVDAEGDGRQASRR